MDKAKKKRVKKYISWVCIVAVVALLAVMPLLAGSDEETDGPQASILSGTVETGSVSTAIHGGGTLAEEDGVEITVPSGVKLTEFLVANGDAVTAGDALAAVDRVSVMTAITEVQETLEYLAEEMEEAADSEVSGNVIAQGGGRVKAVYAEAGDSVQDVMLEHGALAVLSLDGLMAVKLDRNMDLAAGDSVCVTLSDGTEVAGLVESRLNGTVIVTIEDEGYTVGDKVTVTTEDGGRLGSGELYIHNAWKATAYSGTVKSVKIEAEDTVSAGAAIFTLGDTEYTAEFEMLSAQHREYEEVMLELFQLYQNTTITAPCDGVISGVDEDSVLLLSDQGDGWVLSFLANAPNGDDEATYSNFVGMVTGIESGSWNLALNPENFAVTDYKDLSGISLDSGKMTGVAKYVVDAPVYELVDGAWQQIEAADIAVGDTLLFAGDAEGDFVWIVRVAKGAAAPEDPTQPTAPSEEQTRPTEPSTDAPVPDDSSQATEPAGEDVTPSGDTVVQGSTAQLPQTGGSVSGGMSGSYSGGSYSSGAASEEPEYELYDLDGSTIMEVTAQDTMTLEITLDELDISKVSLGQTAEIAVDALKNETFTATVTKIGTSGENSGGSSKFTVELTLDRSENMLDGMNATASITLSETSGILTIPVAALNEKGSETFVYTGRDKDTGELCDPVTVTTGISDGENAEILSGLDAGAAYYYAYYDTLELSTAVESSGFSFGGK